MLKVITQMRQIDISQLFRVFLQSNKEAGRLDCPGRSEKEQLRYAEDDLYDYLCCCLKDPCSFAAVWVIDSTYVSFLRAERYREGSLISGLETAGDARGNGYATALLSSVLSHLSDRGCKCVYSHIDKKNAASLRVHEKCGFSRICDHAVLLDGTVTTGMYTLCKRYH